MLNTSYGHGFHLAHHFRLDPNNYEVLLVVAGLALYTQFGFEIKRLGQSSLVGIGLQSTIALSSLSKRSYDHGSELCNLMAATRGNNEVAAKRRQQGKIADATINSR